MVKKVTIAEKVDIEMLFGKFVRILVFGGLGAPIFFYRCSYLVRLFTEDPYALGLKGRNILVHG
jgi:hypothetical protein